MDLRVGRHRERGMYKYTERETETERERHRDRDIEREWETRSVSREGGPVFTCLKIGFYKIRFYGGLKN